MIKSSLLLSALTISAMTFSAFHAEAREITRTKSVEGAKVSASTDYSRSSDKESQSATSNRVTTTENGKTATTDQSIKINADGSFTATGERTGYSGNTSTYEKTITPTDAGYTSSTTTTGAQGNTVTRAKTGSGLSWRGMNIRNKIENRRGPNE